MAGDFHDDMGLVYYELGLYEDAKSEFRLAIASDKGWSEAHNNLANVFDMTGQWNAAIAEYQTAIALGPRNADPHLGLCTVLRNHGRLREALSHAQAAVQIDPFNVLAHHCMGAALDELGDRVAAERAFRRAIEIRPAEATAHRSLAIVLFEDKRRRSEALIEARKATTLRPDNPRNWSLLAGILATTPLSFEAYAAARKAIELDEGDEAALHILQAMNSAKPFAKEAAPLYSKDKELLLQRALVEGVPENQGGPKQ